VSEGEERHPGWVLEHPGRATRWVRAARDFDIARSGRCADLPYMGGEEDSGTVPRAFPVRFWRVSVAALSSRDRVRAGCAVGGVGVKLGEAGVRAGVIGWIMRPCWRCCLGTKLSAEFRAAVRYLWLRVVPGSRWP
jgi:hypothetical protein